MLRHITNGLEFGATHLLCFADSSRDAQPHEPFERVGHD